METTLHVLMEGLIDYAGLFPPASLDMPAAVRNYAGYAGSAQAAWLGRFILPVSGLGEFSKAAAGLGPSADWRLSALVRSGLADGTDLAADLLTIAAFNRDAGDRRDGAPPARRARIDSIELKAERAEYIEAAMARMPTGLTAYFEIPIQEDPAPLLAAIAKRGARAKVRTGGVTDALFPSPALVARFLSACARAGVPFKATAGLHHPIRSARPLTYAPDSPKAMMHGFLNVFLAAAFAAEGMDAETLADLLREESPRALDFGRDEVVWKGHRLPASRLRKVRRDLALAFGSCSFEEPREDLMEANFL